MRTRWRLAVGLAVSAVFFGLIVNGLDFDAFFANITGADYAWLIPAVVVYFLGVWARTWRWHYMLRHIQPIGMGPLFRYVCIGYMGNNIYPARAGELLRSYVLKRETGVRMSASLATVLVERLFDGLVMLLFVFVALPFVSLNEELDEFRPYIVSLTILFVGALVIFLLLAARPPLARAIYAPLVRTFLPPAFERPALDMAERFLKGLESLTRGREVLMIFATTVVVWLFETGKYWFVMHAFDFEVGVFTLVLMNGIVNLATSLPGLPGHIGTFDYPGIVVLNAAGVDWDTAAAYTAVLHLALWLPITLLGAFFLWRTHVSPRELEREMAEGSEGDADPERGDGGIDGDGVNG